MAYYTLIASLPPLPVHFDVARCPITLPRLEQRLSLLDDKDAEVLRQLREFLAWDRQPLDRTDEECVEEYNRIRQLIKHPLLLEIVEQRTNVRTIVSGLRRRRYNSGPPIGFGQLVEHIRRNWQQPQFGLERRFPWIEEFAQRMHAGEAVEAERVLFDATWKTFSRMATEFTFSFEAVLVYLTRWTIVDRWTSQDAEAGRTRFDLLIEETLGEHAKLQF